MGKQIHLRALQTSGGGVVSFWKVLLASRACRSCASPVQRSLSGQASLGGLWLLYDVCETTWRSLHGHSVPEWAGGQGPSCHQPAFATH